MSKFVIEDSFWNLFPDAKIGVVLLKDFKNLSTSPTELQKMLAQSNLKAQEYLDSAEFSQNDVIRVYREVYQKFKTKKGARSSIEALMKRSLTDRPVGSINPLVDIYNSASLRFALPCGAEDIDTFKGNLKLGITKGGDEFYLIGEDEPSPTLLGELCYRDDVGAVCRCFNWRDGKRTMITENTKNAFLVIELLDPNRLSSLKEALNFIEENSQKYLQGKTKQFILDKNTPEIDL
ncbi:B3/4 domain-containing protein [Metamycoplasma hyosynoviae]|nr:B3/4 domain-containing protein [Metamycoplasma hyosynoviae]MDC8913970.1 B3/4 domain-containing protein [Metamycoplasma hyosynoviae]